MRQRRRITRSLCTLLTRWQWLRSVSCRGFQEVRERGVKAVCRGSVILLFIREVADDALSVYAGMNECRQFPIDANAK